MVVSEDHGSEFIAIADYLNSAYEQMGTERGIAVFLVRLTVERVGEAYVPRFTVVSRPNSWLVAVHGDDELSERTVSAFLAASSDSVRGALKQILEQWTTRPGASIRINTKSTSLSLDYPYVAGQPPRSVYVIYGNGLMTVNRGYFIEFGSLPEQQVRLLDESLRAHFPTLNDKPYYPSVAAPDPIQTARFADWLINAMRAADPLP